MNLLNAVHMLGYAAFWSTGIGTYVEDVQNALGLDALDYRFLGLRVGTPAARPRPSSRPDYRRADRGVGTVRSGRPPAPSLGEPALRAGFLSPGRPKIKRRPGVAWRARSARRSAFIAGPP